MPRKRPPTPVNSVWTLVIVVIPVGLLAWYLIADFLKQERFTRRNVAQLAGVQTYTDAEAAMDDLDVLLGQPEGPWVVIAYSDTHSMMKVSSAVARTSDGRWFVSNEHFCGQFSGYAAYRDSPLESWEGPGEREDELREHNPRLYAIDHAASVDEAVATLEAMGFAPMPAP